MTGVQTCALPILLQKLRIVAVVLDRDVMERLRTAKTLQTSGNGRVGSSGRDPEIVLQDVPDAVLAKNEVDAGNVGEDALRRDDPLARGKVAGRRVNKVRGNNLVRHDLFFVINILQEQIQSFHPLFQAALQISELLLFNDPGDRVIWKELLLEFAVFVDTEFDAVTGKKTVDRIGAVQKILKF